MSDKMNLDIGVDVNVTDLDQATALRREFELMDAEISKLGRRLKTFANPLSALGRAKGKIGDDAVQAGREALRLQGNVFTNLRREEAFKRRMASQRASEESDVVRAAKQGQRATEQALKRQLASSNSLSRQRARAEAAAEAEIRSEISETARMRDRETKKAISDAKAVKKAQADAGGRAARGAGQVRSGVERVAGTAAGTAAVAGYGVQRAVSRGISSRMDADTAETQLKIFADVPDEAKPGQRRTITDADIRRLRRGPEGLDNLAVRTGSTVPGALNAYTEASKAGLIDPMGQTKNILTASSGLELDPTKTTRTLGTLARNMGPAATPDRMYKTLNALAVGAREDPTQSDEIVEGLNRAQGVLAMTKGLTPEDLIALVSGGQSVGIQPGKAGTLLPALAKDILAGNNKFLDPKKRKEHNWAAKKLGFVSGRDMSKQFAGENGKATLYKIFESLKSMAPELRSQVATALSGGQWGDEDLQIVNGLEGMKNTDKEINDPKNSNFLREANEKKMGSWQGQWNQSQAIFSLWWENFGKGFDDILRSINSFFLDLHGKFDYDALTGAVNEAMNGLKKGLGFDTWRQALESLVPANAGGLGKKIGEFAKGFSTAIRDVAGVVKSVATVFTGSNASAESIGRLAGSFVSLGVAAIALAPVMGVIAGVSSIVLGLVGMARAAAGVLGMGAGAAAGAAGGGAVAGALAGIARLMSGGFILGLAGAIGSMRGEISTLILDAVKPMITALWEGLKSAFSVDGMRAVGSAVLGELVPAPLQRWLNGDSGQTSTGSTGTITPEGHATGGYITGPGGPTSDSIMARLSNGEFVVNAAAAGEHRGLLEAINGGMPGYALGGFVGQSPGSSPFAAARQNEDTRSLTEAIKDLVRTLRKDSSDRIFGTRHRSNNGGFRDPGAAGNGGYTDPGADGALGGSRSGGAVSGNGMRGRGIIGGGGVTNPGLSGDVAARAKEAHDFFRAQGYSEEATAGILASLKKESNFTPNARGDGGAAHGIAQWHADRRRQIQAGTGIDVSRASFSDQLKAIDWEMKHGDAGAQRARRALMQPGISASDAGGAFVQHFERPARDERAERGALAEGFHREFNGGGGSGRVASLGGSGQLAGLGGSSQAVDNARSLIGMGSRQAAAALGSRMTPGSWCADFVNGSLKSANIRGVNSSIATSFMQWGDQVLDGVKAGDVVVTHRGRRAGETGGHVGLATGETRTKGGRLQYKTISGNHGNAVGEGWEYADSVAVRRAKEDAAQSRTLAQDATRSRAPALSGDAGGGASAPVGPGAALGAEGVAPRGLGQNTPIRQGAGGGAAGGGGGRVGHTIHAPISITGNQQNPQELANTVQRRLQDEMNRRAHDYDGFS